MGGVEPAGLLVAKKMVSWGAKIVPAFCSKEGEKIPLCGNWVLNATKDVAQLEEWWSARPWVWPGIVSGVDSLILFDVDGSGGVDWFRGLCSSVGWINGSAFVYSTPGRDGGLHVVFRWPEWLGSDFRQAKVYVDGGGEVQLRGQDHFTLLCGARRPDCPGREYRIIEEPDVVKGPLALPEGLGRAFLRESVVSVGAPGAGGLGGGDLREVSPEEAWAGGPYSDGRKNLVAGLAWWCAIRGWDSDSVVDVCVRFGMECCVPALSAESCMKKAEYAFRRASVYRAKEAAEIERSIGRWAKGRVWRS